jgi:hypothetical protein
MNRLGSILPIGLLLQVLIFYKDEIAQGNGNILGYFLLNKDFYFIFCLNKQFQSFICYQFFKVPKVV